MITSLQRYSITLSAGTASNSATLDGGTVVANCIPFITRRVTTNPTLPDDFRFTTVDAYFSGSTVVVETQESAVRAMVVEVSVVEFDPTAFDVQSGSFTMSGDTTTASLSPSVTVADTLVYHTWKSATTTPQWLYHNVTSVLSPTQVTFDRDTTSGDGVTGHWYTAEAQNGEITTQAVNVTLSSTLTGTDTLGTTVTTAKSFVLGSYSGGAGDDCNDSTIEVELTDGDTVEVTRQATGGTITWVGQVVSFSAGSTAKVERGRVAQTTADSSEDVNLSTITDDDDAMIINTGQTSCMAGGSFEGNSGPTVGEANPAWSWVDSDTIRVQHLASSLDNNFIRWEVVQWEKAGAPATPRRVMVVS